MERLKNVRTGFGGFEVEEIILYPRAEERLRKLNIRYYTAHGPVNIQLEE
ncbi:MAG TPA: hypothetical protein VFG09_11990 [Thermodesulfovibrionales bacterium]|jgi:hypothetical protein|nr:hypothetical protein [Thermodesulfovibrionales bacterium]